MAAKIKVCRLSEIICFMVNKKRGFTLIELLVVIAIIGILASVVLASLSTARNKGKDASAQASLNSVRSSAEIYYSGAGANSYGTAATTVSVAANGTVTNSGAGTNTLSTCNDTDVQKLLKAAAAQTGNAATCNSTANGTAYAAGTQLASPTTATYYCVDSTGVAKTTTTAFTTGTVCP